MAELPLSATQAEVEAAYKKALAVQTKLEAEIATCSSPEFPRKQYAVQSAQSTTARLLTRLTAFHGYGELNSRITEVETRQGAQEESVAQARDIAAQALTVAKGASEKVEDVGDAVKFLEAGYQVTRREIERIDSKQRSKNLVVIGLQRGDAMEAVKKLTAGKPDLLRNVDEAFFMSNKPGRRPMLVSFVTKFACEEFLKTSHQPSFTKKFPHVSVVRDRSELRRTGISRLAAAAPRLRALLPEIFIHQRHEYATFEGKKTDAIEFVASMITFGDSVFDVDEACDSNTEFESNDYLYAQVGDVFIFGYRKKGGEERYQREVEGEDEGEPSASEDLDRSQGAVTRSASGAQAVRGGRKRPAASSGTTSGGVRTYFGPTEREGQANLLVMGAISDPYDRRTSNNVRTSRS